MDSMNLDLPESMKEFVENRVVTGGYRNVREYVHELIRDDQKRMAPETLESAILAGLNSGESTPMTREDWDAIREQIRERDVTRQDT